MEKQARELTGKIKNSVCLGDDDGPYAFIPVEPLFLTIMQALHTAAEAGAREMQERAAEAANHNWRGKSYPSKISVAILNLPLTTPENPHG